MLAVVSDVLQNVVFEVDEVFRRADGAEDSGKALRPVAQQPRSVADGQWASGNSLLHREVATQEIVAAILLLRTREHDPTLLRGERSVGADKRRARRSDAGRLDDAVYLRNRCTGCQSAQAQACQQG